MMTEIPTVQKSGKHVARTSLIMNGSDSNLQKQNEPRHDKTNKMSVCPAKTQISLGIRTV